MEWESVGGGSWWLCDMIIRVTRSGLFAVSKNTGPTLAAIPTFAEAKSFAESLIKPRTEVEQIAEIMARRNLLLGASMGRVYTSPGGDYQIFMDPAKSLLQNLIELDKRESKP